MPISCSKLIQLLLQPKKRRKKNKNVIGGLLRSSLSLCPPLSSHTLLAKAIKAKNAF